MEDPEKLKEHVASRISVLRKRAGLTQADVAEAIDTTVTNYQRIEYGEQNLTIVTMTKIANAIGVRVFDFFQVPRKRSSGARSRRT